MTNFSWIDERQPDESMDEAFNAPTAERARAFYQLAEAGDSHGAYKLYHCLWNGWGVAKDEASALHWLRIAAEQGHAKAQYVLGVHSPLPARLEWLQKAAEQGLVPAQWSLGVSYYDRDGGFRNLPEAVKWFEVAAQHGEISSQKLLAEIFYYGEEEIHQDLLKARVWLERAAEVDSTSARMLSQMSLEGIGVPRDDAEALVWAFVALEVAGNDKSHVRKSILTSSVFRQASLADRKIARRRALNWSRRHRRAELPPSLIVFEDD